MQRAKFDLLIDSDPLLPSRQAIRNAPSSIIGEDIRPVIAMADNIVIRAGVFQSQLSEPHRDVGCPGDLWPSAKCDV
jgi:hypothetical protein